jgi:hypothetical protein
MEHRLFKLGDFVDVPLAEEESVSGSDKFVTEICFCLGLGNDGFVPGRFWFGLVAIGV